MEATEGTGSGRANSAQDDGLGREEMSKDEVVRRRSAEASGERKDEKEKWVTDEEEGKKRGEIGNSREDASDFDWLGSVDNGSSLRTEVVGSSSNSSGISGSSTSSGVEEFREFVSDVRGGAGDGGIDLLSDWPAVSYPVAVSSETPECFLTGSSFEDPLYDAEGAAGTNRDPQGNNNSTNNTSASSPVAGAGSDSGVGDKAVGDTSGSLCTGIAGNTGEGLTAIPVAEHLGSGGDDGKTPDIPGCLEGANFSNSSATSGSSSRAGSNDTCGSRSVGPGGGIPVVEPLFCDSAEWTEQRPSSDTIDIQWIAEHGTRAVLETGKSTASSGHGVQFKEEGRGGLDTSGSTRTCARDSVADMSTMSSTSGRNCNSGSINTGGGLGSGNEESSSGEDSRGGAGEVISDDRGASVEFSGRATFSSSVNSNPDREDGAQVTNNSTAGEAELTSNATAGEAELTSNATAGEAELTSNATAGEAESTSNATAAGVDDEWDDGDFGGFSCGGAEPPVSQDGEERQLQQLPQQEERHVKEAPNELSAEKRGMIALDVETEANQQIAIRLEAMRSTIQDFWENVEKQEQANTAGLEKPKRPWLLAPVDVWCGGEEDELDDQWIQEMLDTEVRYLISSQHGLLPSASTDVLHPPLPQPSDLTEVAAETMPGELGVWDEMAMKRSLELFHGLGPNPPSRPRVIQPAPFSAPREMPRGGWSAGVSGRNEQEQTQVDGDRGKKAGRGGNGDTASPLLSTALPPRSALSMPACAEATRSNLDEVPEDSPASPFHPWRPIATPSSSSSSIGAKSSKLPPKFQRWLQTLPDFSASFSTRPALSRPPAQPSDGGVALSANSSSRSFFGLRSPQKSPPSPSSSSQ
eukprot:GHVS01042222.1.p1 GENE.GHVS01042222.1~~GHVS01042222.1.p1  ORF type:complete len:865 (+),score=189.93 GHVS01042222.1:68-2662(+)